jgi:hypothetical protein
MNNPDKSAALSVISTINEVEGFDPASLAVEYTDFNSGEKRLRLPVMAQVAWFRLKYPDGRFTLNVTPGKDCFVATARVYRNYMDPLDNYLAEASTSRGYLPDKPTINPREWAQTAALGIALRNAGFGLQFHAAGEGFDESAVNEMAGQAEQPSGTMSATGTEANNEGSSSSATNLPAETPVNNKAPVAVALPPAVKEDPLECAMKMPCPISKYKGKTLGDMVTLDPRALVWVATKFAGDAALTAAAKLICDNALAAA